VALLLIDVINDLEFEGSEALVPQVLPMARRIAELKRRAREAGIPVIYVNDNFGRWKSDFRRVVEHCLHDGSKARSWSGSFSPARTTTSCSSRSTPRSTPRRSTSS
jgi:nicotinamidase-related amidase